MITINYICEPPSVLLFPMKYFVSHNLTVRSLSQSNQKTQHKHMTQHSCTPVCVHFMCNTFAWLLLKLKYCIWARMRYKILHHLWLKHRNMHLFIIRLQCQNIKGTIYSEMKHQRIKIYINNASLYVTINLNKNSREINAQKGKRVSHICHRKRMIASVLSHQEWRIRPGWIIIQHETADLR